MKILAIDTSGLVAGAAIVDENGVIGEFYTNFHKTHSQTLMPLVERLLGILELKPEDMDYVACASGPGSFTGLRIGAAAAKAIAHGTGKPLIPVPTLDALAYNVFSPGCIIAPLMDARRGQVYTAFYELCAGAPERLSDYLAEDIRSVTERLRIYNRKVIFLGDGVRAHLESLLDSGLNMMPAPAHMDIQRAAAVGVMALRLARSGNYTEHSGFKLFYLRKAQAEREYRERLNGANQ